jgi:predicted DNA-binding ArsR family transcriptional regulator
MPYHNPAVMVFDVLSSGWASCALLNELVGNSARALQLKDDAPIHSSVCEDQWRRVCSSCWCVMMSIS